MNFKNIKNTQWANVEKTILNCEVDIEINGVYETVPFTASAEDFEQHGKDIFLEAIKSEVAEYVLDTNKVKHARIQELKQLLRDSDYVALADYDQDKPELIAQRQAWRVELRGLDD